MVRSKLFWSVLFISGICLLANFDSTSFAAGNLEATHKQVRSIVPKIRGQEASLHTYCVGPDNNLWLCCSDSVAGEGALLVYSGEGEMLREIKLSFLPQAINFAPDKSLFVGGSGKIAKLTMDGEITIEIEAPNLNNSHESSEAIKKAREERMESILSAYNSQREQIDLQIATLEKTQLDSETEKQQSRRERRLKMLRKQKEQFDSMLESVKLSLGNDEDPSSSRLKRSTAIAASDSDVFVSLPAAAGYGYNIWRMDHAMTNPTIVVKDVGGCCGQLDIQCNGQNLVIAENTKFEVGVYDREGKRLRGFGKRASFSDSDDGFGSCCNPMNVRCVNGEILTAESSIGDIKRYTPEGELIGYVGRASVGGGCKHVAVGVDASRNWHYMMVQDSSSIAVLVPNAEAPAETEDERIARIAMEGLGKKMFGTWEMVSSKEAPKDDFDDTNDDSDIVRLSDYNEEDHIKQMFGHLEFAPGGKMLAGAKTIASVTTKDASKKSSGGIFGAIASLFSSTSSSSGVSNPSFMLPQSSWSAIREHDGKFDFVTVQSRVRSYGATVEFIDGDQAKFTWFYGSPSSSMGSPILYKRVSSEACGKNCESDRCPTPESK